MGQGSSRPTRSGTKREDEGFWGAPRLDLRSFEGAGRSGGGRLVGLSPDPGRAPTRLQSDGARPGLGRDPQRLHRALNSWAGPARARVHTPPAPPRTGQDPRTPLVPARPPRPPRRSEPNPAPPPPPPRPGPLRRAGAPAGVALPIPALGPPRPRHTRAPNPFSNRRPAPCPLPTARA